MDISTGLSVDGDRSEDMACITCFAAAEIDQLAQNSPTEFKRLKLVITWIERELSAGEPHEIAGKLFFFERLLKDFGTPNEGVVTMSDLHAWVKKHTLDRFQEFIAWLEEMGTVEESIALEMRTILLKLSHYLLAESPGLRHYGLAA